jgi:hypothetical protein
MTQSDKPETPSGGPETPQGGPAGYPPPPPQPYSYPPPPPVPYSGFTPPPTGPKNGLGVAALVIAIVALVSVWSVFGGVILGLVAVVIGFAARGRVKRGEATNGGVAIAGIVLGFLAIVVGLLFIPIWIGVFKYVGGTDYVDCLSKAGSDQNAIQKCADQFRNRIESSFSVTLTPTP